MLEILFSSTFWYIALAVVAVVVIIWACIKFPQGKIFVGTILGIAILCFTAYAGVELNFYYSASGGIYGAITGIFDTNIVEVDNSSFKIQNLELTQDEGDTYSARILTNDVIVFEQNKVYGLYINDTPAKTLSFSTDYIQAQYSYVFYDNQQNVLENDSLYINMAFYTNSTSIEIYTNGGEQAVKYWNYWFNKNTFVITIKEAGYIKDENIHFSNLSIGNDESLVTYYCGEQLVGFDIVKNGSKLEEPSNFPANIQINGWMVNDEPVDITNYIVNDNTEFHADYTELIYLELRTGTLQSYTIIDSGYYNSGTTFLDCLGHRLPYSVMTKLLIELYDGNYDMNVDFGTNVEDIAGGIVYINGLSIISNELSFASTQFDSKNQHTFYPLGNIEEEVDLSYVSSCYVTYVKITHKYYAGDSEITIYRQDFQRTTPTSYSYYGDMTWRNDAGEFTFSYMLDSNMNLICEASDNLITDANIDSGTVQVLDYYRFTISGFTIEFSPNVFYLV